MPSVGDKLKQVRETEGRVAAKRTAAGYLRMRYLSRDSAPAVAQIRMPDGSAVSEDVIESEAQLLEREALDQERSIKAVREIEVADD